MTAAPTPAARWAVACAIAMTVVVRSQNPATQRDATSTRPEPTGTAAIAGAVIARETNQPLRRVRVMLNNGERTVGRTTTTDDQGRFAFSALPEGRYVIETTKPPFIDSAYGASRPGRAGTPVAVSAGQTVSGLVVSMSRGAVITGRLSDDRQQPLRGAAVSALKYGYSGLTGERQLNGAGGATTDDLGEYRIYGLPPGDYVVMAEPVNSGLAGSVYQRLTPADIERGLAGASLVAVPGVTFSPVFFPGTADFGAAASISVEAGQERSGIDLQLQFVPAATVRGQLTMPAGARVPATQVSLTVRGTSPPQSSRLLSPRSVSADSDGSFSFRGVPPGQYTVLAKTGAPARGGPMPNADLWWASADVAVSGQDQQVALELQPGLSVAAHVTFDSEKPPTPEEMAGIQYLLQREGQGGNLSGPQATVDANGLLSFKGLTAGRYALVGMRANSSSRDWWVKSATIQGRELPDGAIRLASGESLSDWKLVFTDHPSEISGTLQTTAGRPAPDYFIVAFSTNQSLWMPQSRYVSQTRPGQDGSYAIRNLPPGEYYIAALTDFQTSDLFDPAFFPPLIPAARKTTLADGEKKVENLRIVGR